MRLKYNRMNSSEIEINEQITYQTMRGFGASACWWAQEVGNWDNVREILSLLWSKKNGIGLNIYRYNLGAGTQDDPVIVRECNRARLLIDENGSLIPENDFAALNCLEIARELYGGDLQLFIFSNSPPAFLTKNGKGYGDATAVNSPYVTNIEAENYIKFADFLFKCARYFLSKGYNLKEISPVNEPQYKWRAYNMPDGRIVSKQEGCHYEPQELYSLYVTLIDKIKNSDIEKMGVKLSFFESGEVQGYGSDFEKYLDVLLNDKKNNVLKEYFNTIAVHSYWSSDATKRDTAKMLAEKYPSLNIAMTEYCQMINDSNSGIADIIKSEGMSNGLDIRFGVAMANIIIQDLTLLNAVEWTWWLGCSFGIYTDGLIYLDCNDHENIQASKRLWCLGNFSKFIKKEAVRISCNIADKNLNSVAFVNPDGKKVIVLVNSGAEQEIKLPASLSNYSIYVTDDKRDLEEIKSQDRIIVPTLSVVTINEE